MLSIFYYYNKLIDKKYTFFYKDKVYSEMSWSDTETYIGNHYTFLDSIKYYTKTEQGTYKIVPSFFDS